jgi:hypothetical protein
MEKGYSHKFRFAVISVLMAGFLAHLVLPFSSHAQKTAFTQWLDHNVVATGDENEIKLRNTIRQLPERTGDFWVLIQEASELVSSHKDDFRLRVAVPDHTSSQDSFWLIGQWTAFQHQQTGTNAILPDAVQSVQKWIASGSSVSGFPPAYSGIPVFPDDMTAVLGQLTPGDHTITPLESGISINAP